jgi:hypothetical protein
MTVIRTLTFTAADGTAAATAEPGITKLTGSTGDAQVFGNRLRGTSTTSAGWRADDDVGTTHQKVSMDIYCPSGGHGGAAPGVVLRDDGAGNYYWARLSTNGSIVIQLYRVTGAGLTFTPLGSVTVAAPTSSTTHTLDASVETVAGDVHFTCNYDGAPIKFDAGAPSGIAYVDSSGSKLTAGTHCGWRESFFSSPTTTLGLQIDNVVIEALAAAAATAVTMSGPSGGASGAPSTDFTIGANGSITGDVEVTPDDGGAGGTFTPTSVTINTAGPTDTFTYTPATTGAITISVTNDGGLTNPSDITYTATGANVPPVWDTNAADMSAKRGQALTPQDLSALVSDADMDTLAFACSGLPTGVSCDIDTGIVSGTPTAAPGVYTVTPAIYDGVNSPVDGATFDITVVNVHDYTATDLDDASQIYSSTGVSADTSGTIPNPAHDGLSYGEWYLLTIRKSTGHLALNAAIQAS